MFFDHPLPGPPGYPLLRRLREFFRRSRFLLRLACAALVVSLLSALLPLLGISSESRYLIAFQIASVLVDFWFFAAFATKADIEAGSWAIGRTGRALLGGITAVLMGVIFLASVPWLVGLSLSAAHCLLRQASIGYVVSKVRSNMALNLAPFGRWTLRDKAAQRRLALRWASQA